jgi:hypothetical protein
MVGSDTKGLDGGACLPLRIFFAGRFVMRLRSKNLRQQLVSLLHGRFYTYGRKNAKAAFSGGAKGTVQQSC